MKKRLFCTVLSLLLALLPLGACAEAVVPAGAIRDDGLVRVYLKSLAAPQNLTITLDGEYTIEHDPGFRFERGACIVLSRHEGRVWLCVGGLKLDMGPTLTLTRQRSGEALNGMRIAETGRDTLYAGDLTVCIEEGDAGLRAVLTIPVEDYLCGVVAYEMSDSWPLEALKAQAVAARTYAMQRKANASPFQDYDLVDTTADQVFKGYNPEYTQVEQAVRDTEGVVGRWKDSFATCYYTASNGGQTALPTDVWTIEGDFGYLARTRDVYDLENPNSMVSSVRFSPDASDLPALRELLEEAMAEAAQEAGLQGAELEKILAVRPVDPVEKGSVMYRTLRFSLSVSVLEKNHGGAREDGNIFRKGVDSIRRLLGITADEAERRSVLEEPITVDLEVYGQVKPALNLALNGSDYELVSVNRDDAGFVIEMRRFGHGVGMSQRGAQRMAGVHGKNWLEILSFYYPGMELERILWNTPELKAIEELPAGVGAARPEPTPTPAPAPLPALEAGEYYAAVTLGDASSSLNMRQSPTTQSPVVTMLSNGRRVIVSGEADADGWVAIRTAEFSGYAKLEYLEKE